MERLRPQPVAALCAVTLFIWVNRIWLAWTNPDDSVAQKLLWSVPIVSFVVAAVVLLVLMWRGIDRASTTFVRLVQAFSLGTIAYWAIRMPMIAFADHPVGFVIVHSALAFVSIGTAVLAFRSVRELHRVPVAT